MDVTYVLDKARQSNASTARQHARPVPDQRELGDVACGATSGRAGHLGRMSGRGEVGGVRTLVVRCRSRSGGVSRWPGKGFRAGIKFISSLSPGLCRLAR